MPFFNRFMAILMTIVMLGPMLPLEAKTRKGDKYLAEGRTHEEKKEWDAALEAYEKALSEDPGELTYQMAAQKARFETSAMHISNGVKIRAQGQLGEALLEFQKGYALSPASSVAEQEILRTEEMIRRERRRVEQTGTEAPPEVRGMTPSEMAKKDTDDRINRLLPIAELKPLKPALQDFKMINQTPKVLFDTLALNAGLNILYDPDYLTTGPKDKHGTGSAGLSGDRHQVVLEADQRQYDFRHHGQPQQASRLRRGSDADFLSDEFHHRRRSHHHGDRHPHSGRSAAAVSV